MLRIMTKIQADEIFGKENVLIEAPAGYGKTEMIADLVECSEGRMLVLTHTNAGVEVLENRMAKRGISQKKYAVSTIDAFCVKWCTAYPFTSKIDLSLSPKDHKQVGKYYKQMRLGAKEIIETEWAGKVLSKSYSGVIVDEYQDCTRPQHDVICAVNKVLHVYVFGDFMQGIFSFTGEQVDSGAIQFEKYEGIETRAHRWDESNPELGEYLTKFRGDMKRGLDGGRCRIHLDKSDSVEILDPDYDIDKLVAMAERFSSTVFITKKVQKQKEFCIETKGRFQYDETKECADLYFYADKFDTSNSSGKIYWLERFINECFRNVERGEFDLGQMEDGIAVKQKFSSNEHLDAFLSVFEWVVGDNYHNGEYRLYRTELFEEMVRSVRYAKQNGISIDSAASIIRLDPAFHKDYDKALSSASGFMLSSRTLLSKGLEFDCVIIDMRAYPDSEWSLDANDFYVAMTRAKKKIYLLSSTADFSLPVPSKWGKS